jgi:uncharacterized membrane protein HdeD (DUF308 family)
MLHELARNWWVLLLNGLVAIAFGVMVLAWPGTTLLTLVILFGVYALIDGFTAIMAAIGGKDETGKSWGHLLLVGVISILAGITAIVWPGLTQLAVLVMIASWAIVRGTMQIVAAVRLRKVIDNELLLGLAGAASVIFGILLIARPGAGILAMAWLISLFAFVQGILLVSLAFKLRRFKHEHEPHEPPGTPVMRGV